MSVDTEYGYSYEYAVDINTGTTETPAWQTIRFSSAINPQVTEVFKDGATYDDEGAPHQIKTAESWTVSATIQAHRQSDGTFLPEVEALLAATRPDATGTAATREFRWYDDPVNQNPNPDEAYQGTGTVNMTRQNTGNDDLGGWAMTVTGQGRRTHIANPSTATSASGAPVLLSALPTAVAAGGLLTITGTGFTGVVGATGVKVGGVNATSYVVVSPTKIVATMPAGSGGSAPVIVTNGVGASAALAYTRA